MKKKPNIVLGLATGSTPLGLYKEMSNSNLNFSRVCSFNLDEYYDIDFKSTQSYHYYMERNLFSKTGIHGFLLEKDPKEYERMIKEKKGIDLQILGIGRNGHIGFNEPGSAFESRTRVVDLEEMTRKDNQRFFKSISDVPKKALTMGMATIMEAKEILLLVSGKHKADILKKALRGEITTEVPASILQKHNNLYVIIDKEAASLL